MKRRVLLLRLAALLCALSVTVRAQERGRVPVVGVLTLSAGPDDPGVQALRDSLRELGYVEGRGIRGVVIPEAILMRSDEVIK
jgi:hypothetical protein